jgi:hypothetical protein
MTARALSRHYAQHGTVPARVFVTSPYSGAVLSVVAAEQCGHRHVRLRTGDGKDLVVDKGLRLRRD